MIQEHFTFREVEDYAAGRVEVARIAEIHRHAETCAPCRALLEGSVLAATDHIEEQQAVDFAAGLSHADEAGRIERHIEECAECAAMVADLKAFRESDELSPARRTYPWLMPLAAAVVLTTGISTWVAVRPGPAAPKPVTTAEAPALTQEQSQLVDEALRTGRLPAGPAALLHGGRETLRSESSAPRRMELKALAPEGGRVLTDKPEFRWTALPGASWYEISVFDENFNPVASSGKVHETSWTPSNGLPRMKPMFWQVATSVGGTRITAPAPPETSPRFEIISEDNEQAIAAARALQPPAHLLLAALYAKAGLRYEAEAELDALEQANPGMPQLASLRDSLPAK